MLGYWFLCDFVVVQAGRGQQPGVEQQHYAAGPTGQAGTYPSQAKEQSRRHLLTDTGEERIKSSQRTEYCTLVPSQAEPGSKQC